MKVSIGGDSKGYLVGRHAGGGPAADRGVSIGKGLGRVVAAIGQRGVGSGSG